MQADGEEGYFGRVRALAQFRDGALGREPSDRALARVAEVSNTTVGSWLYRDVFPQSVDKVVRLIDLVRAEARRQGELDAGCAELLDPDAWRQAYEQEARQRASVVSESVLAAKAREALADDRPGKPVSRYRANPLLLEVHRAVELGTQTDGMPKLPRYVDRAHDRELAEIVRCAADGSSAIVTLVGGSSTGKTRACWEAVRDLGDDWRLWHPISPGRCEALLDGMGRVGPRTVIWLNEAQHYLGPAEAGEKAAARLRELLADTACAPVLVLATVWPRNWRELTWDPTDGGADPHSHARALLTGSSIDVPDAFNAVDMIALRRAAADDPRLARAAADTDGGRIIQYLAGVPALLSRYRTAPAPAKALIHAAMDARRLGAADEWIPLEFLRDAAPGYLTDLQWMEAADEGDWVEEAIRYTRAPCKGVPGPLTPPASRRGQTTHVDGGRHYRLADYLEQIGRSERSEELPPATFWEAGAAHSDTAGLARLAGEACRRGLYRQAARMVTTSQGGTETSAASHLARAFALLSPDSADAAARWAVRHTNVSNGYDVYLLAKYLAERRATGLVAELLGRVAVEASGGDAGGMNALLDVLGELGGSGHVASFLARDPAAHVSLDDLREAGLLLRKVKELGAEEQFQTLADRLAEVASSDMAYFALSLLQDVGAEAQRDRAAARACDRLDPADTERVTWLLSVLHEAGDRRRIDLLLERDLTSGVSLHDVLRLGWLLGTLHRVGAARHVALLMDRVTEYAARASSAWLAELHMMARELSFDDTLTALLPIQLPEELLPIQLPEDDLDLRDSTTVAWLVRAARTRNQSAETAIRELILRSAARPLAFGGVDELDALVRALVSEDAEALAADVAETAAGRLRVNDAAVAAWRLRTLREFGRGRAVDVTLAESPARTVMLDHPGAIAALLAQLRILGRSDEISVLLDRDLCLVIPLAYARGSADLLRELNECATADHVAAVAARAASEADLSDHEDVLRLMDAVRDTCATEQLPLLAERAAAETDVSSPGAAKELLAALVDQGLGAAVPRLLSRIETDIAFGDRSLREQRYFIIALLKSLRTVGAHHVITTLASRLVAEADFSLPGTMADIAGAMAEAGAQDQVDVLALAAANSGNYSTYLKIDTEGRRKFPFGREPDGTPTPPWSWQDLHPHD